jgi:hypothetical protein
MSRLVQSDGAIPQQKIKNFIKYQLTFPRLHEWWTFSIHINWWSGYHSVSEGGTSRIQSTPFCPITDKAWQWY